MATPAHSALAPDPFREALLAIMDRKNHWAWPLFAGGRISTEQLKIHFRQEYAVYVRDFPVLLARAYGKNPPSEVRSLLAENIYEEDTGRLSLDSSPPHLRPSGPASTLEPGTPPRHWLALCNRPRGLLPLR